MRYAASRSWPVMFRRGGFAYYHRGYDHAPVLFLRPDDHRYRRREQHVARVVGHALLAGKRRGVKYVVITMAIGRGIGAVGLFEVA